MRCHFARDFFITTFSLHDSRNVLSSSSTSAPETSALPTTIYSAMIVLKTSAKSKFYDDDTIIMCMISAILRLLAENNYL